MATPKPDKKKLTFMDDEQYFSERLQQQIDWHNKKADENKQKYKKFKRLEFILAASIPVVIGISTMSLFESSILFHISGKVGAQAVNHPVSMSIVLQLIAVAAGVILAIVNKTIELEEFFKNWKDYRTIEEYLQNHKILYLTQSAPYDDENAFHTLVSNVESFLAEEIQKWQKHTPKKKENELVKNAETAVEEQRELWKLKSIGKDKTKKAQINKLEEITNVESTEDEDEDFEESTNLENTETGNDIVEEKDFESEDKEEVRG
jgi:hypothetical protein